MLIPAKVNFTLHTSNKVIIINHNTRQVSGNYKLTPGESYANALAHFKFK